ncbi:MAG: Holliday junction resolvase RuvX [Actinomycetota bacterium]
MSGNSKPSRELTPSGWNSERTTDGAPSSPAAIGAQREAERIGTVVSVPVVLFDERMTTVAADRALREADISASRRRQHVDRVAAAVMLQAWLDRGRPT